MTERTKLLLGCSATILFAGALISGVQGNAALAVVYLAPSTLMLARLLFDR